MESLTDATIIKALAILTSVLFAGNIYFVTRLINKMDSIDILVRKMDAVIVCLKRAGIWIDIELPPL